MFRERRLEAPRGGSAFCVPINQSFFLSGARLAPASHIALIYAACPLVVLAPGDGLDEARSG